MRPIALTTLLLGATLTLSAPLVATAVPGSPGPPGTKYGTIHRDVLIGTAHRDLFHADAGPDLVRTGRGNDWINGGRGNDILYGGPGTDAVFDPSLDEAHNKPVPGIDQMHGGAGRDTMYLGPRDKVWAGPGNDRVQSTRARAGWINCGKGRDTVYYSLPRPATVNCEVFVKMADPTW